MLLPPTTSYRDAACEYRYEAFGKTAGFPANAITPAMRGEDTLVPPTTYQPAPPLSVSYTAGPVYGSATAATSAVIRPGQFASCCHAGLSIHAGQPLEAPVPAVSLHPP